MLKYVILSVVFLSFCNNQEKHFVDEGTPILNEILSDFIVTDIAKVDPLSFLDNYFSVKRAILVNQSRDTVVNKINNQLTEITNKGKLASMSIYRYNFVLGLAFKKNQTTIL